MVGDILSRSSFFIDFYRLPIFPVTFFRKTVCVKLHSHVFHIASLKTMNSTNRIFLKHGGETKNMTFCEKERKYFFCIFSVALLDAFRHKTYQYLILYNISGL